MNLSNLIQCSQINVSLCLRLVCVVQRRVNGLNLDIQQARQMAQTRVCVSSIAVEVSV